MTKSSEDRLAVVVDLLDEFVFVFLHLVGELALTLVEHLPVNVGQMLGNAQTPFSVVVLLDHLGTHFILEVILEVAALQTSRHISELVAALLVPETVLLAHLGGERRQLPYPVLEHLLHECLILERLVHGAELALALG